MTESLPIFRYHPDPVATGMVVVRDGACACCGRSRGYIYIGPVYSAQELRESLCPWCIADGSAADKLGASFADAHPLVQAGLADSVVDEVTLRTPCYVSWQQDSWLTHCSDACEFHGDASARDVRAASGQTKQNWLAEYRQDEKGWLDVTQGYQPGCDSALYKFVCRHCRVVLFGWDMS